MLLDIVVVDVEVVDVEVDDVLDLLVRCKNTPVAIPPVTNPKTKPSNNHFFFETFWQIVSFCIFDVPILCICIE